MFQKVIEILKRFDYHIDYSPYHTDDDIRRYALKNDNVSKECFFTVYTPDGYVVGRIYDLKEDSKFNTSHLKTIISYFKMFEIPHSSAILKELENTLEEIKKN